jgi:hypothetical protein
MPELVSNLMDASEFIIDLREVKSKARPMDEQIEK